MHRHVAIWSRYGYFYGTFSLHFQIYSSEDYVETVVMLYKIECTGMLQSGLVVDIYSTFSLHFQIYSREDYVETVVMLGLCPRLCYSADRLDFCIFFPQKSLSFAAKMTFTMSKILYSVCTVVSAVS
jgi:hypothetical protein